MTMFFSQQRVALAIALLGIPLAVGCGRDAPGSEDGGEPTADVYTALPAMMEAASIPGLAVAVVNDDQIREWTLGVADATQSLPVTRETVFEAASLTKPVFAYAVLRLVERGLLDLDRPLSEIIDVPSTDFSDLAQDPRLPRITPRRVLTHTTGLPNWRRGEPLSFQSDPGADFGYSGEGFAFLQRAVEALTGKSAATVLHDEVLEPLGMDRSSLIWREDYDSAFAAGHDLLRVPREKNRPQEGDVAGDLHTTAGDFALFLREMMRPTLLNEETVQTMLTPASQVEDGVHWGWGWGLEDWTPPDRSHPEILFWHWGNNGIFRSYTTGSRSSGRAVVVFANSENGQAVTEALVHDLFPGTHPALEWRDFTAWDSPALRVQRRLIQAGVEGGAASVRSAYQDLRSVLADDAFEEAILNRIGYQLLHREVPDAAVEVFQINVELYPQSWNVWDSLGEGLMESGRNDKAIEAYQKSLEVNPDNHNGRRMLERLKRSAG